MDTSSDFWELTFPPTLDFKTLVYVQLLGITPLCVLISAPLLEYKNPENLPVIQFWENFKAKGLIQKYKNVRCF